MSRRISRENAMKLLYQFQLRDDDVDEQIEVFISEMDDVGNLERAFFLDIIHGVRTNEKEIDELIKAHAKGWSLERMPKVDIAIIRLAIYELIYRDDIPFNVTINEAVELAKKYSTDQSGSFINGVLGKVLKSIEPIKEN
ncbi:MAG: transcription antitermination factor NusB [Clostridiaceae bacterium]|nr:transcription antitermination factor NusB [Clostridiaceae bacterium]